MAGWAIVVHGRFSTLNRVYVLGTATARTFSAIWTGFSTLNRVYVLGTPPTKGSYRRALVFQYPQSGLCAWNDRRRRQRADRRRVSVPSIGFMCLEQEQTVAGHVHQVGFSTLNRVYVLGTATADELLAETSKFQYPQSGLCAWNNAASSCASPCCDCFSTLNRVYVLGTKHCGRRDSGIWPFQYPQSGLCAWNTMATSPPTCSASVSVPSIGFMCLELTFAADDSVKKLFQYPQSGLCAWNVIPVLAVDHKSAVSVPSIGFMCLEHRSRRPPAHRMRSFSTLNRVYVLGTTNYTTLAGLNAEFQYPQSGLCAWNRPSLR